MDVDKIRKSNRCFNCGETGHFRRDCTHPQKARINVRALALELEDDERAELVLALTSPPPVEEEVVENVKEPEEAMDFL